MTVHNGSARNLAITTSALAIMLGCAAPATAQTTPPVTPVAPTAPRTTQAPTPDTTTPDTTALDEATTEDILVVGTRASLQSAIARKRKAGTVVDSIVADDIASFPDKNIGDSLARITGVQLSRDFGEGQAVSIRGVEPDLNRVEINGVTQASADGSRSGDLRDLATELVKSIDVYKGYTVDLTEGGLGGTVSVETRRPLELLKPLASLVVSAQHLDTAQQWRPRLTAIVGTPRFLLDGLGFLGTVNYEKKQLRQDYISNTNWKRIADFDRSDEKTIANPAYANFNTYGSCAGVGGANASAATARRLACETQFFDWVPTVPRLRQRRIDDQRLSADLQVQYEFAPNFRAFAEAIITNRKQQFNDVNYSLDLGRFERFNYDAPLPVGLNGATSRPQISAGTSTSENHVVTSALTAVNSVNVGTATAPIWNGASNILGVQRRDFQYDQKTRYYLTGFDWTFDNLKLKALASHSTGRTVNDTNLLAYSTGIGGITIDRRNDLGIPVFVFPENFDPASTSAYVRPGGINAPGRQAGPTVQYRPSDNNNKEDQLKLDADWKTNLPFLTSIEYGGQFRWQEYENYNGGGSRLLRPAVSANPSTGTPAVPAVYQTSANVSYTTVVTDTPPAVRAANTYYMTQAQYAQFIATNSGRLPGAPLFSGLQGAPDGLPGQLSVPAINFGQLGQIYDLSGFDQDLVRNADGLAQIPTVFIKETIAAAYLKGNFEQDVFGMRFSGNAGLRYIKTTDTGTGTNISRQTRVRPGTGVPGIPAVIETVVTSANALSLQNSYTDWLPAFNGSLDITPNLTFRANWARNLARPKPTDLVPNVNCLDDVTDITGLQDACTAGNPDLVPYRADQWEVNLGWFPNKDTALSIGYFKKYEKSFVISNVTRGDVDLFQDGTLFSVRQPVNGFGALLDGIEASAQTAFTFLPAPFDGFGASGNVTYARAIRTNLTNVATGQPLDDYPGLSKWTANASIFYDKDWLNIRVNYNYRSDWLVTVADVNFDNSPIYRGAEGYLDAKVTFRFPEQHTNVFMEMQNINKESSRSFIDKARPVEYYYAGQRFFAGFQVKF
ncbi:TonB-dependent receptor [Sphingomonas sp. Leaf17]|uniref:TonB-dependent receptor n=1 Tax=Sphingomonas sp. Leaf17 TaxID=1735683 RepID=UPI0006F7C924|nr:TonB-dependent receptor [Sphingomonas sp. Leaf17]KQM67819.1 TonB-dependent receptor [Sphingomonas sp. Leaf17]